MIMKLLEKNFYNTILSTAFSPCGNYFACGNIYGDIVVYKYVYLLYLAVSTDNPSVHIFFRFILKLQIKRTRE